MKQVHTNSKKLQEKTKNQNNYACLSCLRAELVKINILAGSFLFKPTFQNHPF